MPAPPLILLPGLGATSEIFAPQRLAFPNLQTPEWPDPGKNETLAASAGRMAAKIDPGVSCVVGGISFGGILATELCRHLDASHCALISTVRHPKYMPLRIRMLLPIARHVPAVAVKLGQALLRSVGPLARRVLTERTLQLYRQGCDARPEIVSWSLWALATWEPSADGLPCAIAQLHGSRDFVFPPKCAPGAQVVPGGRHVLTISSPKDTNRFLSGLLEESGSSLGSTHPGDRIDLDQRT
jgi:pimeloyl-ACP methyl ester carboxylesterase